MPDGTLIARGRDADVYAGAGGTVVRRYRSEHDTLIEAALMQHVRTHGFPAPHVVSVAGAEMVMERLDGPTMLRDIERRPWRMWRHVDALATLLEQLHAIPVPPWLPRRHERGVAIVHLDLHPDNVMLTSHGPVVIDWGNAGVGDPAAEVADLWLILSTAEIPSPQPMRSILGVARRLLVSRLLSHFDIGLVRAALHVALERRTRDPNMAPAELERMRALVEREST